MEISVEDFNKAVEIANRVGLKGREVEIIYEPPPSATELVGVFVVQEFALSGTGGRDRV